MGLFARIAGVFEEAGATTTAGGAVRRAVDACARARAVMGVGAESLALSGGGLLPRGLPALSRCELLSRKLPALTASGRLPAGVWHASWGEFAVRFGTTPSRVDQLCALKTALDELGGVGVDHVVIGGSFVGGKPHPNDVDLVALVTAATRRTDLDGVLVRARTSGLNVFATDVESVGGGGGMIDFFARDSRTGRGVGLALLDTAR